MTRSLMTPPTMSPPTRPTITGMNAVFSGESEEKMSVDLGSMIAPDPDSARCLNCKLWTMSPVDATKGACWAEADAPEVTGCVDLCGKGSFAMRMTA